MSAQRLRSLSLLDWEMSLAKEVLKAKSIWAPQRQGAGRQETVRCTHVGAGGMPEFALGQAGVRQHAGVSQHDGTQPKRAACLGQGLQISSVQKSGCGSTQVVAGAYCSNEGRLQDQNPGHVPKQAKRSALPETKKHTVGTSTETPIAAAGHRGATGHTGEKGFGPVAFNLWTWCTDSGKSEGKGQRVNNRSQSCQKCQS